MMESVLTYVLVATALLVSPCFSLECMSGTKNHMTSNVVTVPCNTKCLKTTYMTHTKIPGMSTMTFEQSTLGCALSLEYCTDLTKQCKQLKAGFAQQSSIQMTISDCTSTCCSTSNCNTPGSSAGNPAAVMPSGPVFPTGNPFTLQPSIRESATNSRTCNTGVKNYVINTVKSEACPTACVTNDIQVFFKSSGMQFSFYQSTFLCAPMENYCTSFDMCSTVKSQLKNMDLGMEVQNFVTRNCKTTCCTTDNCNQINPAINYQLGSESPTSETTKPAPSITDEGVTTTTDLVSSTPSKVKIESTETPQDSEDLPSVRPNIRPSGGGSPTGSFTCKKGLKNFVIDTVTDVQCSTTCVKNDLLVFADVEGKPHKFYQSTMMCAPVENFCPSDTVCSTVETEVKKMDLGSTITNLKIRDCSTNCCNTSNCNQLSAAINYKLLDNGAIKYVPNFMILVLVSFSAIIFSTKL